MNQRQWILVGFKHEPKQSPRSVEFTAPEPYCASPLTKLLVFYPVKANKTIHKRKKYIYIHANPHMFVLFL